MEWPAVRQVLQAMVPASYWTALECHEDGAWSAYTPGLPVDGGLTIAGSRSAAYFEAQRRIAVTIRNMYEVGQRVPPLESAMSLSAAQAWDSSHREVFELLDEDIRGGAGNSSTAPKIVERQWRQVYVDLSLADHSPLAADRAELREALRQRGVRNIWASDPESTVDEEEEEGDEEVDADEEEDDEMVLDMGQGDDGLGIVASEEPPYNDVMPGSITFGTQRIPLVAARREFSFRAADGQQVLPDISEEEFWRQQRSRDLALSARDRRAQDRAAGQERAVRPRTQSHLETLAGMLSSEEGLGNVEARAQARAQARILEAEALRPWPLDEASQGAAGTPDQDAVHPARHTQQPGLRALEHRDEEMALPEAVRLAHLQSAEEDRVERMLMLRREEAARTTRRHSERQRSFTRMYQAARAGTARPGAAHRTQPWKQAEAGLC
ncbi:g43 [Coccomyxa viridis]|uniref:G43 protein n=1 Tax=Coccomyxa viridis TaxID=1274662 RepID=A0ABP1FET1_9CHLO